MSKGLKQTLKSIQQIERYKRQAKKLADQAEKAGVNPGFVERFREDFSLTNPVDVEIEERSGEKGKGQTIGHRHSEKGEKKVADRKIDAIKASIVKVGDGRGFVVKNGINRLILTAAHCLPHLPPPHIMANLEEKTFRELLSPLGEKPKIWAECLFVNPVDDVAVLGSPDGQELFDEADAYSEFAEARKPIRVREAKQGEPVWMLSIEGEFKQGVVMGVNPRFLLIDTADGVIQGGMSGSPILGEDGCAVSLLGIGGDSAHGNIEVNLWRALPGGFLQTR